MCLAIPGKTLEEFERGGMRVGKVQFGGIVREAALAYVPHGAPVVDELSARKPQ
jgi:hydrogenase expression/formation protein HypC